MAGSSRYFRDVNLSEDIAGKYEIGQILTERAFLDATDKIGGLLTTHRYLILSSYMADFSKLEKDTNWGLHAANRDSRFKVIDIYEFDGKTQIALVQLPEGFESVFENTLKIEKEIVEELRHEFKKTLKSEPIPEVNTPEWYLRCSFPIGMSDEGEFFYRLVTSLFYFSTYNFIISFVAIIILMVNIVICILIGAVFHYIVCCQGPPNAS